MNHSVIRYRTKPEATQENAQLVKDVFRELAATAPTGVRYCVLQAEDGTFFHLVSYESKETQGAIPRLAAFQKFQENGEDRRVAPPEFTDVTIVGNYGVLAD